MRLHISELTPRLLNASGDSCPRTGPVAEALTFLAGSGRDLTEETGWYIHEGDLWLADDAIIDASLIVTGDLIIKGICSGTDDGGLLVLGNMYCAHMVSEQTIWVRGNLICGGLCYDDWILEVAGTLSAHMLISEDASAAEWKAEVFFQGQQNGSGTERGLSYYLPGCEQ
jgi:hypothetical protein